MTAQLIDGRAIAARIRDHLAPEIERFAARGRPLRLVSIEVGDDPAAALYVRNQKRSAERTGIRFEHEHLVSATTEEELAACIRQQNEDPTVTGVIVQRPLPDGIDVRRIQAGIDPRKDVEGMHPENLGRLALGRPVLAPCTARGALELLLSTGVEPRGLEVVVVGHSEIVGKPLALLLLDRLATVSVCHIGTRDVGRHTRGADAVFVAVGKPGLITGADLKPGAIVIDIGINEVEGPGADGQPSVKIVGDVDFESARQVAGYITPVPGGVGPMTVAMLLKNAVEAARLQDI